MRGSRVRSFFSGMLVANSAPHLASAVAGRRHMPPVGGRNSGPRVTAAWSAANLAGGVALLVPSRRAGTDRWDADLVAFGTGYVAFAAWMALTERFFPVNHDT